MAPRAWCSLVLLLLLAPLSAPGATPSGDDWLGRDKALHFGVSAGLAGAGYLGGALLFEESWAPWLTGAGLALGAGLGKELYDAGRAGNHFSFKDLTWDVLGTASGLAVSWLVEQLLLQGASGRGAPGGKSLTLALSQRGAARFQARGEGRAPVLLLLSGSW